MEDNNQKQEIPSTPQVDMQAVDKVEKKLAYSSDTDGPRPGPGGAPDGRRQGGRGQGHGRGGRGRPQQKEDASGMVEKVIRISRVAKVTKGGTKLSFTALVVVGDAKGRAGYALGKAAEVAINIHPTVVQLATNKLLSIHCRKGFSNSITW